MLRLLDYRYLADERLLPVARMNTPVCIRATNRTGDRRHRSLSLSAHTQFCMHICNDFWESARYAAMKMHRAERNPLRKLDGNLLLSIYGRRAKNREMWSNTLASLKVINDDWFSYTGCLKVYNYEINCLTMCHFISLYY